MHPMIEAVGPHGRTFRAASDPLLGEPAAEASIRRVYALTAERAGTSRAAGAASGFASLFVVSRAVVRTLALPVLRQALGLVRHGSSPDAKDVQIAVLRRQLLVLRRQATRRVVDVVDGRPDRPGIDRCGELSIGVPVECTPTRKERSRIASIER
jgi:hypothetical protein